MNYKYIFIFNLIYTACIENIEYKCVFSDLWEAWWQYIYDNENLS